MVIWASLVAQMVKNLSTVWETWIRSLGWEDPLEKGTTTHCSILAWRITCVLLLFDSIDCSPPGSFVCGISQAMPEWVAVFLCCLFVHLTGPSPRSSSGQVPFLVTILPRCLGHPLKGSQRVATAQKCGGGSQGRVIVTESWVSRLGLYLSLPRKEPAFATSDTLCLTSKSL